MPVKLIPIKCQLCGVFRKVVFVLHGNEFCGVCYRELIKLENN